MPPKKTAVASKEVPKPPKSDASVEKKAETKPDDVAPARKPAARPSTSIMVKEAIKALDSRKGVSSQAIQGYIKQTYPSVDPVRLKHLVRNGLKKGLENGTLVRPANSTVPAGATGKFRLGPEVKKPKMENTDPDVQKAPKAAKGKTKPKKEGATKKKKTETADEQTASSEDFKPPKSEDESVSVSKVDPAKKPKLKKAVQKASADKTSAATAKKATQKKSAEGGSDASTAKAPGRRGRETRKEDRTVNLQ